MGWLMWVSVCDGVCIHTKRLLNLNQRLHLVLGSWCSEHERSLSPLDFNKTNRLAWYLDKERDWSPWSIIGTLLVFSSSWFVRRCLDEHFILPWRLVLWSDIYLMALKCLPKIFLEIWYLYDTWTFFQWSICGENAYGQFGGFLLDFG